MAKRPNKGGNDGPFKKLSKEDDMQNLLNPIDNEDCQLRNLNKLLNSQIDAFMRKSKIEVIDHDTKSMTEEVLKIASEVQNQLLLTLDNLDKQRKQSPPSTSINTEPKSVQEILEKAEKGDLRVDDLSLQEMEMMVLSDPSIYDDVEGCFAVKFSTELVFALDAKEELIREEEQKRRLEEEKQKKEILERNPSEENWTIISSVSDTSSSREDLAEFCSSSETSCPEDDNYDSQELIRDNANINGSEFLQLQQIIH